MHVHKTMPPGSFGARKDGIHPNMLWVYLCLLTGGRLPIFASPTLNISNPITTKSSPCPSSNKNFVNPTLTRLEPQKDHVTAPPCLITGLTTATVLCVEGASGAAGSAVFDGVTAVTPPWAAVGRAEGGAAGASEGVAVMEGEGDRSPMLFQAAKLA